MSRPLRLEFAGALYHITSRGDRRENIYEDDSDRHEFLSVFTDVCRTYNWVCYAYCLMTNHYHLLVETPDANLSRGMRQLNGVYTQRYNKKHNKVGHLLQGRYQAILVDKDSYLLELSRYIVLNPVRACMVKNPADWPWSSYCATQGASQPPEWLSSDSILSVFAKRRSMAVNRYGEFVKDGISKRSPWARLKNQIYLGSDEFVERMTANIGSAEDLSEIPSAQHRPPPRSLEHYKSEALSRDQAIADAYFSGGYTQAEIGRHFGLHYSRISRIIKRAKGKT